MKDRKFIIDEATLYSLLFDSHIIGALDAFGATDHFSERTQAILNYENNAGKIIKTLVEEDIEGFPVWTE